MMRETNGIGLRSPLPRDLLPGQSLATLLALVGSRKMEAEALRRRTKLTPSAFRSLIVWLQKECLVDVVSSLSGDMIQEKVELTEKGEETLVSLLEQTCELPELR
jgi:hypothetical protein